MTRTPSIFERFKEWKTKTFPEKQLFLRSEGRVRFITIGTHVQMSLVAISAGLTVWGLVASYSFFTRDQLIRKHETAIASAEEKLGELASGYVSLETDLSSRAKDLEARQRFLEEIIKAHGFAPSPVTRPVVAATNRAVTIGQSAEGHTHDSNDASPADDYATPQAPDGSNQSPRANGDTSFFNSWTTDQNTADAHTQYASTSNPAEHTDLLNDQLSNLHMRQHSLALALQAFQTKRLNDINSALKGTPLNIDTLSAAWTGKAGAPAQGGPFEPFDEFENIPASNEGPLFSNLVQQLTKLEKVKMVLDSLPIGEPTRQYYITSPFGRRIDPLKKVAANHPGLDLGGKPAILATAPGKVVHASWYGPYGNMVEIDHGNGFRTRYGHMRRLYVKKGQMVQAGHHVGDMGRTGRVTNTHLHYEVWFNGKVTDPLPFLEAAQDVRKVRG